METIQEQINDGSFCLENLFKSPNTVRKQETMEEINDEFRTPLYYCGNKRTLGDGIVRNLEMIETVEETERPIYAGLFKPSTNAGRQVLKQLATCYTTDTQFLKEMQMFVLSTDPSDDEEMKRNEVDVAGMIDVWDEITKETGFCEKYMFVDWTFAKSLNKNSRFLQIMSLYNIASPIMSLCIPVMVLILPFVIIQMKGIRLTFSRYIELVKSIIASHAIGKIFTEFHGVSTGQKVYLLVSVAFYLFSIYQNALACIKFYTNMNRILSYLKQMKQYLDGTIKKCNIIVKN